MSSGQDVARRREGYNAYSKGVKAKALAQLTLNGGNQAKTAREMDIPRSTLRHWDKHMEQWLNEDEELRNLYESEVDGAETILRELWIKAATELLKGDRLSEANAGAVNAVFGTAFDKWRLASGQSTQNIDQRVKVVGFQSEEV